MFLRAVCWAQIDDHFLTRSMIESFCARQQHTKSHYVDSSNGEISGTYCITVGSIALSKEESERERAREKTTDLNYRTYHSQKSILLKDASHFGDINCLSFSVLCVVNVRPLYKAILSAYFLMFVRLEGGHIKALLKAFWQNNLGQYWGNKFWTVMGLKHCLVRSVKKVEQLYRISFLL